MKLPQYSNGCWSIRSLITTIPRFVRRIFPCHPAALGDFQFSRPFAFLASLCAPTTFRRDDSRITRAVQRTPRWERASTLCSIDFLYARTMQLGVIKPGPDLYGWSHWYNKDDRVIYPTVSNQREIFIPGILIRCFSYIRYIKDTVTKKKSASFINWKLQC